MSWGIIEAQPLNSILDSTARINIWHGPVRSSKTVHSLIRWLEYTLTAPEGDLFMVGKTEQTLQRNILEPLSVATSGEFSYSMGRHKAYLADRTIYTIGANDERAEQKIRGATGAGAYGDEIGLWPESFFKQMLARLSVTGAKFFGTTNPDSPYLWLKTDFLDREDELDLKGFTWPIDVNRYLDPAYIKNLKNEYVGLWNDRFIKGLWVAAEGAVYPFFDEKVHVTDELLVADYYTVAVDYGIGNATVFLLFGHSDRSKPKVWLEREYYWDSRKMMRQKTNADYAADFTRFLGGIAPRYIIIDPSAASFRVELIRNNYRQVRNAKNDVLNGIATVGKMLQSGEYRIHRSARETIKEYGGYRWDEKAQSRGEDKPIKENDHAADAQRYDLHTIYGRSIQN